MRRAMLVATAAVLVLAGCESGDEVQTPVDAVQPESRDEGIQATGQFDGARVAISRANPTVVVGDCDANDGLDEDLCILARTIDGVSITLVIENPAVLRPGESVDAGASCAATDCDGVSDGAVVELRIEGERIPVTRGTLQVEEAGPRWVADFELFVPDGRLNGTFDVAPTPIG